MIPQKSEMIPKKIHYCWFGTNKLPAKAQKCISSWRKYCPDYEIIEWNEQNFDMNQHPYLAWCYANKKWAFLSDLARLLIIQNEGGIYFDTDVEVIRNIDFLLNEEAFFAFEHSEYVATGLGFGAVKGHKTVEAMVEQYRTLVPNKQGIIEMIGCPTLNTRALLPMGLQLNGETQSVGGAKILASEYMNPYDDPTGRLNKTENTISIHWYTKSALDKKLILRSKLTKPFHRIFGVHCFRGGHR